MERLPITASGYEELKNELRVLKSEARPNIIQAIAEAREFGDLSENAEYHAARERQSLIEGRITNLEDKISRAEVIDVSKMSGSTVKFGATVKIFDDETEEESIYQLVGETEANIDQKKISYTSPIARALIGKSQGDVVEFVAPSGTKTYEILSVEYK